MVEPIGWTVVVRGAWNRAILTPAWIQKRMLGEGGLLEVQVILDGPDAPRVRGQRVVVQAGERALLVEPTHLTFTSLADAMAAAGSAVEALPETPLFATGFNVRFKVEEVPAGVFRADLDGKLIEAGMLVVGKQIQRSVPFREGLINLTVEEDIDGHGQVLANFHRDTRTAADARAWLQTPIGDVRDRAEAILRCIGLDPKGMESDE